MLLPSFHATGPRSLRLEQGRVMLRPPRGSDWREWARLRQESRIFLEPWEPTWPYDALSRGAFRRRLRQYVTEWRHGIGYAFLIFTRAEPQQMIGGITLSNVRRGVAQTGSLGYWIGARHAREGYMTEALGVMLNFGFERLGLHRLEAACLPNNEASRRLLLKLGFHQEGFARGYLRIDGEWRDHLLFAILRDDPR
jgi:ribosomal-protein-alanine N-acetyltransferase